MATTYTPNLGLRVDSGLTPNSVYNLNRIDTLAGQIYLAVTGGLKIRSSENITLQPQDASVGGTPGSGTLSFGSVSNALVGLNAYLAPGAVFNINGPMSYDLTQDNIIIGDNSNKSISVDLSAVGDISASYLTGLTIKPLAVDDSKISDVDSSKVVGLSALLALKADLSYVNGEFATIAGQILALNNALTNHTSDTDNPHNTTAVQVGAEPTLTKGSLSADSGGLSVSGGVDAVIGAGAIISQTKADATHDGYLSKEDWALFSAGGATSFSVFIKTLDNTDISNGYITLPVVPGSPSDTQLSVRGGPSQTYGALLDFTVSGANLIFSTATLDSLGLNLSSGDILTVTYH